MPTFALLQGDEGGITMMSYDWQLETKLPAQVLVGLDLFNERHDGSNDEDASRVAQLLSWRLADIMYEPTDFALFERQVAKLVLPGPPVTSQLTFDAVRTDC